jgi:predicted DNA-binding transcriptional regulator AlpA
MTATQETQTEVAQKAAALKASNKPPKLSANLLKASTAVAFAQALRPDDKHPQHDRKHAHAPRGPPRLLSKSEVLHITGASYQSIWKWMRAGKFPRSRIAGAGRDGSKSVWLSTEIEEWLSQLPVRPLKGDAQ